MDRDGSKGWLSTIVRVFCWRTPPTNAVVESSAPTAPTTSTAPATTTTTTTAAVPSPECWICSELYDAYGELPVSLCHCPADRVVHPVCMVKWQLASIGRDDETTCRMCRATLPDWRDALRVPQAPGCVIHFTDDFDHSDLFEGQATDIETELNARVGNFRQNFRQVPNGRRIEVTLATKVLGIDVRLHSMDRMADMLLLANFVAFERTRAQHSSAQTDDHGCA